MAARQSHKLKVAGSSPAPARPNINMLLNEKERGNFQSKLIPIVRSLETPCLEWSGYRDRAGYGQVKLRRLADEGTNTFKAHRVAMADAGKMDLHTGLFVCHRCDNPSCCNPEHLFVGTPQDNVDDMHKKKRNRIGSANGGGEKNGNSKLTENDVTIIVSLLPTHNNKQISRMFNDKVSHSAVSLIRLGKSWSSFTGIAA